MDLDYNFSLPYCNKPFETLLAGFLGILMAMGLVFYSPGLIVFLGLFLLFFFLPLIRKHFILFLVIYVPFEEFILKWVPHSTYSLLRFGWEGLAYGILGLLLIEKLCSKEKFHRTPIDLPLLLFALITLIPFVSEGVNLKVIILGIRPLVRYIALYYIIVLSKIRPSLVRKIIYAILIVGFLQSLIGMSQYLIGEPANNVLRPRENILGAKLINSLQVDESATSRLFGTLGRYSILGNYMVSILLMSLGVFYESLKKGKLFTWVFIGLGLFVLVFSYSRTSWLGFVAGFMAILFMKRKTKIICLLTFCSLIFFLILPSLLSTTDLSESEGQGNLASRFMGVFSKDYINMSLDSQRLFILTSVPQIVMNKRAFFGFGAGTVASLVSNYAEGSSRLEEIGDPRAFYILGDVGWVGLMAQVGILGTICFIWLILRLLKVSCKNYHNLENRTLKGINLGFIAYTIALIVENFFSASFEVRANSVYFWVLAGMIVSFSYQKLGHREK
jgi:hypothetical protein